ncbi:MAG: 2-keto-4-pentenoate hydratase [Burkholderiaceae bacterium]
MRSSARWGAGMRPSEEQLQEAADELYVAAATRVSCGPVRNALPSATPEDAYTVQHLNTSRYVRDGRVIVGRKIGLTSPAVQRQLGVDQPDFGTLFADMAYADGETMPWHVMAQARVEAEVALVLERDLTSEVATLVEVLDAIAYALPAIEVVGSRIAGWDIKAVDTIADNASAGVFVLGHTPVRPSELDLRLVGMVMERRGEPVSFGAGAACLGHPLNAALWLARKMAVLGTPLRAGDTVLSGALGPMVSAFPGDVFEARIEGLGSVRAVFGTSTEDA